MHLHFIGDFKKLKDIGFKFGKYYASNYIGYEFSKNENSLILIWKSGKDLNLSGIEKKLQIPLFNLMKTKTIEDCRFFYQEDFSPICLKFKNDIATPISVDEYLDYVEFERFIYIKSLKDKYLCTNTLDDIDDKTKRQFQKMEEYFKETSKTYLYANSKCLLIDEDMLKMFKYLIENGLIELKN